MVDLFSSPADDQHLPVLVVEQSKTVAKLVSRNITSALNFPVATFHTFEDAQTALHGSEQFLAAVVGLELLDSDSGEIVDLTINAGLPTIVLTGTYDQQVRERILAKAVVDYYLKEEIGLREVNQMLQRLTINPHTKILVVDDSSTHRLLARRLLEIHRFQVFEAKDGQTGLDLLKSNPDICLLLTDYEMPELDGLQLVGQVRKFRARDDVAIIGLSSAQSNSLSAMFLKYGADDFLAKPFQREEFYCRVYRAIETVEHIREIKRAAFTDQLTRLSNRLHFFQSAPPLFEQACQDNTPLTVAMIDIDHFKSVNDTYGHAGGDMALQQLSMLLTKHLRAANVIARFGGEEFCIVISGQSAQEASDMFERLRKAVEENSFEFEGRTIQFTLSTGICYGLGSSLDAMINHADEHLYEAKESGRNRTILSKR